MISINVDSVLCIGEFGDNGKIFQLKCAVSFRIAHASDRSCHRLHVIKIELVFEYME